MNVLASSVLLLALAHSDVSAQQSDTAALVEASKAGKARRKSTTTKVITNSDVAKASKSKISVRKGVDPGPVEQTATLMERHEADRKTRLANEANLKVLNDTIARLEKELTAIEQSYYEENDLDRRDKEIVRRFSDTQARLDEARKALATVSGPPALK